MILEEFDKTLSAVINPSDVVEKIKDFPDVTISCFSNKLFDNVLSFFEPDLLCELHSATGVVSVYKVKYKGDSFAFFLSYVGEPACVAQYEDLIAMGSKCLILTGNCGVLDKNIEDCGILSYRLRQSEMRAAAITMLLQMTL